MERKQLDKVLASIHRMPTTVFLGLFAYLIVSYAPLSSFHVLLLSALVYIILVSAISVVGLPRESTLTFADPTNRNYTRGQLCGRKIGTMGRGRTLILVVQTDDVWL